jgi:hypothetical protein
MLFPPIKLSDKEKLETLRRLDQFRHWHSLDDKRYCLVCGAIITGRDIGVIGGERGTGPVRVICPTRNCHSIPLDWMVPSDEVLAKISARAAWRPRTRPGNFTRGAKPVIQLLPVCADSPAT